MSDSPTPGSPGSSAPESFLTVQISYRKTTYPFTLPSTATITDLSNEIAAALSVPVTNQKLFAPKLPLLKYPFKDPDMSISTLTDRTLTLMGAPTAEIEAVQDMAERVAHRHASRFASQRIVRPAARRQAAEDLEYTFLKVLPLQGLPHPERSHKLLLRLKADPGIRATMRKHKFTVSLLTEMEPLSHTQTTHEGTSRTLGLNRNKGEVIELRLRTDAHDGYRDYKTIRKTLCHELTHNVHSPHDRNFWDLCHQIEREVQAADWKSGGNTIGESSRYALSGADEEDYAEDHGGWVGGEFVLGGAGSSTIAGLSRREVLAQAALERQKKDVEAERKALESIEKRKSSSKDETE